MDNFEYLDLSWFSQEWFTPSFFKNLHWKHPFFLYIIPVVPFLFVLRRVLHQRLRQKAELSIIQIVSGSSIFIDILRRVPYLILSFSLILILIALARPQTFKLEIKEEVAGFDILLVMDTSESMLIEDMKPNRLTVAKELASEFIRGREHDQIGMVVFNSETYTVCPLTRDHSVLQEYLNRLDLSLMPSGGTAIGDALATAYLRLQNSKSDKKIIILITDGENTSGAIDPENSAKLAAAAGIKIHTISLGTEGKVLFRSPEGQTQWVESYPDLSLLKKIASVSKGNFYKAMGRENLKSSFSDIGTLTKTKVFRSEAAIPEDVYHIYLVWAMIFFIVWMFSKSSFMANALED